MNTYWETVSGDFDLPISDARFREIMLMIVVPGLRTIIESAADAAAPQTIWERDTVRQAFVAEVAHLLIGATAPEFLIHFSQLSPEHAQALYGDQHEQQ